MSQNKLLLSLSLLILGICDTDGTVTNTKAEGGEMSYNLATSPFYASPQGIPDSFSWKSCVKA
jgi:hypothetical protein